MEDNMSSPQNVSRRRVHFENLHNDQKQCDSPCRHANHAEVGNANVKLSGPLLLSLSTLY
jgi:hypothetical protein